MTLKIKNVSRINLVKNYIAHGRSKHIEMRFHYLREQVSEGRLELKHYKNEDQVADLLTEGVTTLTFNRLNKLMRLETLKNLN